MNGYEGRKKAIGDRIKKEREALHISKGELLSKIFMSEKSHKTVTAWENGERLPDLESLARMADLFCCDIGYLLCDYDERTRDLADVCAVTGLCPGAVNAICYMTKNGKKEVLDKAISNYHFFSLLGLIYRLSEAKAKDGIKALINSQFGDISEKYVYEAVATNEAGKLVSDVSDELKGVFNNG